MLKLVKLPNHKKKILTAYCEHMIIEKLQRKNDENLCCTFERISYNVEQ